MEKENTGFALGNFVGHNNKEEYEASMREYERRKANADKIEAGLMAACVEVAARIEKDAKNMTNKELAEAIGTMLGLSTGLGMLGMYAVKPYSFGCA